MTTESPNTAPGAGLDALFAPRSIAIIGASNDWRRFGGRPLHYLQRFGFDGAVYPVNPGRAEVQGVKAYADVRDVGAPIDCALLSVTAEDTIAAMTQCAEAGVRSAVLFGAGFAEVGGEGPQRQQALLSIARQAGMRVLGPNCMGLVNAQAGVYSTFASAYEDVDRLAGSMAVVTQSGGYGGYLLKHCFMRGLGVSHFVATGNEADVDVGEALAWVAAQEEARVLLGYLEGVRNAASLVRALEIARRLRKPVVMMKVGRTPEGRVAAASHTASLTGEDAVYDALFSEYGVWRARTTDELLDVGYALSRGKRPRGPRTGVISISGGVGVQMADFIADAGLALGTVPEPTKQRLREIVPYCSPSNPIDMTGLVTANHDLLGDTLECVLESEAFDAVILFLGIVGMAPTMAEPITRILSQVCARYPERLLLLSVTTPPELRQTYDQAGFLVYEDPSRAVAALRALDHFERFFGRTAEQAGPVPLFSADLLPESGGPLNEVQAKRVLAACGIRPPREHVAMSPEAAAAAARDIGLPVAVKVVSPDIAHKTEHGGVALGVVDEVAVQATVERMDARLRRELPDARIDGYLVSEMVQGGTECILGVTRDPVFGPVVTFGLGGVAVELLRDVVSQLAPVGVSQAMRMMRGLRSWPLLAGWRGAPPADTDALAQAISALSHFAVAHRASVAGIEVNPVVVLPKGQGLVALDAVIQIQPQEPSL
ncbi:acetate--CoA ligase family protein [uncultured Pseudacidovorax sp.]|uniref:acetate--CoA ligase family protein n=1 Tax=uncultured Pseudacidovorax sp. TaxID=679313 RepID=UPI0025F976B6|nr:acetate--CoA ligase family protein [uncultured Pseudacidovorax sp.]